MRSPIRFACAAVALLPVVPRTSTAQARVPAWTYTMNITLDSGGGRRSSMAMRHQVSDRVLRQEIVQMSGDMTPGEIEGTYTLLNDADSTLTTVMPRQHTAMVMPIGRMFAMLGASMPKPSYQGSQPTIVDLGNGGKLLGHPTRHVRMASTGTFDVTVGNQVCHHTLEGETEMWLAPDIGLSEAMLGEARHYLQLMSGATLADTPSDSGKSLLGGMPLKTVTRSARGGRTVTMTMEVVELSHDDVDASLFEVPVSYRKMDMAKMMARVSPQVMDSIVTAQQKKSSPDCGSSF